MDFFKVKLLKKNRRSKSEDNPDQENVELVLESKNATCNESLGMEINGRKVDENVDGNENDEEDEDDDDFITNEVKRRLKELRKNSFMVLIPEETCQEEEEQEEEEEEETSSSEWREAEAEKVFPWFGFDALYNKYCERMLFFDKMSAQQLKEAELWNISTPSPRSTTKKLSLSLRNISLKNRDGFQEEQEQLHQPEEEDPYNNLETAYVAQICLTWETLHCQYMQLCQKMSSGIENSNSHCYAADAFQQFQVLLQRFIENEPFEQGSRVEIFARTRRSLPMLLQVPNFQGLDQKENAGNNSDSTVLAPDLLNIIQDSILTFHRFLRRDKEKSNHGLSLFKGNNNQDASSLHQVQASLCKKETKVKELSKKKSWKKKSWPTSPLEVELLLGLIDIKVISRVLRMAKISKEQLLWCEEKMSKISLFEKKLKRDATPILFPC